MLLPFPTPHLLQASIEALTCEFCAATRLTPAIASAMTVKRICAVFSVPYELTVISIFQMLQNLAENSCSLQKH